MYICIYNEGQGEGTMMHGDYDADFSQPGIVIWTFLNVDQWLSRWTCVGNVAGLNPPARK